MHLTDVGIGALGSFAVVGAHLPFACGTALAAQTLGTGSVSLCFFGDGSTNIGAFHEAMNLASVWKLGVVFVCENNLYGEYSPIASTTAVERLADRAAAYAMPGAQVDGNDVDGACAPPSPRRATRARGGRRPDLPRGADLPAHGPLAQRSRRATGRRASSSAGGSATRSPSSRQRLADDGVVARRPGRGPRRRPAARSRRRRRARSPGPSPSRTTASRASGRRRDERASPTARR